MATHGRVVELHGARVGDPLQVFFVHALDFRAEPAQRVDAEDAQPHGQQQHDGEGRRQFVAQRRTLQVAAQGVHREVSSN